MQEIIERYFNISHDASASLITTLIIFVLGYLVTAFAFILTHYLNRRSNRKIFIENLKTLNKSLKRQEKGFVNTILSLDIVSNSQWQYHKVDLFQIQVFKEMSYKETFKSFFIGMENNIHFPSKKRLRRKAFNKLWENINNLEFWHSRALNDFYSLLDKYNLHGDRRNNAALELRKYWDSLFPKFVYDDPATLDPDIVNYLNQLSQIVFEYSKTPTYKRVGPFFTQRNLILKIRILNRKYAHLQFVREINEIAMEVSTHYQEMERLIRNTKVQYKLYYHLARSIRKTNEKIIAVLD